MSEPAETQSAFPWAKRTTIRGRSKEPILCCRFTPDDGTVIVGHYDGLVVGYDAQTFAVKFEFNLLHSLAKKGENLPVTSVCVRPTGKPVLLVTATNGLIERYELRTMERISQFVEEDNEIYSADYNASGVNFATCGRDAAVRVYDDASGDLKRIFRLAPDYPTNVAALRLFSIRFDPQDPMVLYSGGWSNSLHRHRLDEQEHREVGSEKKNEYFGAYLTGDAMDISKGKLVTASNRIDNVIQIWDITTRQPTTVDWPVKFRFLPNCAKLSPDGNFLAVGGGGGQGLKEGCFVMDLGSNRPVVEQKLEKSVTSCSFAWRESLVAFGDAEGLLHLYENRFAKK